MTRPATEQLLLVLQTILPDGNASSDSSIFVDDNYYRAGPALPVGQVHGGFDFYYIDPSLNAVNGGHPSVYAPVTGTLLALTPVDGGFGSVFIRDSNGFVHSILHLDTRNDSELSLLVDQTITAGTLLGTMGGRGPSGPNEFGTHIHYSIFLPGFDRDSRETWSQIDPAVYLDTGLDVSSTAIQ